MHKSVFDSENIIWVSFMIVLVFAIVGCTISEIYGSRAENKALKQTLIQEQQNTQAMFKEILQKLEKKN